jgi:4-hydroxybenzoate polyprenyltransferase
MALVFTAIADSSAALMLTDQDMMTLSVRRLLTVIAISVGLYGYGMSLNDIIDRRRDRQIAAHRPLPSGRIGLIAAHVICVLFGLLALSAGILLARHVPMLSLLLLVWTGGLITFYDFAGKYMVAPGLLTLGLIRFFHATIPAPQLPLLWHPLLLLNHVAILSTVAYAWEQKRPALTRIHWWFVIGGLMVFNTLCVGVVWGRRYDLMISRALLWPAGAVLLFVILAVVIRVRSGDIRAAGRNLMLAGLLWLIIYDASFVLAYVSWRHALGLLMLLPIAYLAVIFMRWWAKILLLSQKPEYQRAR